MVRTPFDNVTSASDNFEFSSIRISNFSHKDSKVSSLAFSNDKSSLNGLTKVGFWTAKIGLKNLVWALGFQFCPKVFWMQRNLLNIFDFLSSSFQTTRLNWHSISTIFPENVTKFCFVIVYFWIQSKVISLNYSIWDKILSKKPKFVVLKVKTYFWVTLKAKVTKPRVWKRKQTWLSRKAQKPTL